jgi:hypothetical protein
MSIITNLLHFGMIVVGPPYCATAFTDEAGQRHPNALDLEGARQQGRLIAQTADRLTVQTADKNVGPRKIGRGGSQAECRTGGGHNMRSSPS